MKVSKSTLALVVGGAFTTSVAATSAMATDNPFSLKPLASGYMVADHHGDKDAEGKCGAGKCGAEMKSDQKVDVEAKCGSEMKSEQKTEAEGKCGADKRGAEKK
jgi:uncharacterized low-complexity protein